LDCLQPYNEEVGQTWWLLTRTVYQCLANKRQQLLINLTPAKVKRDTD